MPKDLVSDRLISSYVDIYATLLEEEFATLLKRNEIQIVHTASSLYSLIGVIKKS